MTLSLMTTVENGDMRPVAKTRLENAKGNTIHQTQTLKTTTEMLA
mgnify:CR=1 FL=1